MGFRTTFFICLVVSGCRITNDTVESKGPQTPVAQENMIKPPIAEKQPYELEKHGDIRIDDYYWMKLSDEQKNAEQPDQQTQKVLDYLNAENKYTSQKLSHLESFREELFNEIIGRIKQTDISVPYLMDGYYYLTRYNKGSEYPIYARKKGSLEAEEQVLLDVNKLAEGYEYFSARGLSVSPNDKLLAYGEDTVSRRIYHIRFKDLETGGMLDDVIENTTGTIVWAKDNKTVFYTRKDESLRAYQILKHVLGTPSSEDKVVYHEKDETFSTYVFGSKSKDYIMIGSWATVSSEYRYIKADEPDAEFQIFQERRRDHEYDVSHFNNKWYIVTNKDGAKNFKVMVTDLEKTSEDNWVDYIAHRKDVFISSIEIFKNYLVVNERIDGVTKVNVIPWLDRSAAHHIAFEEETYVSRASVNREFDTDIVRVYYSSLVTPGSTYDYDMSTKTLTLMKQQEVVGGYDKEDYVSERISVTARDGSQVPVSFVSKKGVPKDGSQPVLLYAYGSYGSSTDPYFSSVRLSLLDRGFAFAMAHVRGGQELGRQWYEDGKMLNKKNTFYDFIDVGKYLIKENYTSNEGLFCLGGSAGGLLVGSVINMEPSIWKGAIAAVPFVDVITTMLDETIPLTTGEYDEWGNPNEKKYYDYIKTYSPYDNVEKKEYPALLVTTGYHDSQVQYWEPAKWVAKLRDMKTDNNLLLLHTEMGAGHGGKSGRFQRYHETAMEYAFLLDLAGKVD